MPGKASGSEVRVCEGRSIKAEHRALYEGIVAQVRTVPGVKQIGGHSDEHGLLVAMIVDTNDEDVWDRLSDIEYDTFKDHPEIPTTFRECDAFSESEIEFMHDLPPALVEEFADVAS